MAKNSAPSSTADISTTKLSSPRIFLVRMLVFLILCGLLVVVLYKQIWVAFLANPGLNALIGGVLAIGIILSFRQVVRLYPEISWVNHFRISDPGLSVDRRPILLAPMAAILSHRTGGRMSISQQTMRHLLDSIATRLDESRDLARYMTGLLVFLGLLGTFWGLIETVGSVGKVIEGLKVGGESGALFDTLKDGLAAPLAGMGISFSSSLFGLAGSLILGFLDLQSSQAQNRFYTDLEDWLAETVQEYSGDGHASGAAGSGDLNPVLDRLRTAVEEMGSTRATTTAMANLAEAIQGLVHHMRTEQQLIREWADGQGEQNREIKGLLERLARQPENN
ncbi:MAG: flagellar motor protein MotA [Pseudomonadota bacterium]